MCAAILSLVCQQPVTIHTTYATYTQHDSFFIWAKRRKTVKPSKTKNIKYKIKYPFRVSCTNISFPRCYSFLIHVTFSLIMFLVFVLFVSLLCSHIYLTMKWLWGRGRADSGSRKMLLKIQEREKTAENEEYKKINKKGQ